MTAKELLEQLDIALDKVNSVSEYWLGNRALIVLKGFADTELRRLTVLQRRVLKITEIMDAVFGGLDIRYSISDERHESYISDIIVELYSTFGLVGLVTFSFCVTKREHKEELIIKTELVNIISSQYLLNAHDKKWYDDQLRDHNLSRNCGYIKVRHPGYECLYKPICNSVAIDLKSPIDTNMVTRIRDHATEIVGSYGTNPSFTWGAFMQAVYDGIVMPNKVMSYSEWYERNGRNSEN